MNACQGRETAAALRCSGNQSASLRKQAAGRIPRHIPQSRAESVVAVGNGRSSHAAAYVGHFFFVAMPTLGGPSERISFFGLSRSLCGLLGLVLLFDFYCLYQQYQIYRIRKRMVENEKLFHLIGEHAVLLRGIRSVLDRAHEKIPTVK